MKKMKLKKWVEETLLCFEAILIVCLFVFNTKYLILSIVSEIIELVLFLAIGDILVKYTDIGKEE